MNETLNRTNEGCGSAKRQPAGFTLVEIMIAIFLLATTALIFGVVYPSGAHARTKAQYYSIAVCLAQQKLEEARHTGYTDLTIQGPADTSVSSLPSGNLQYTVSQYSAGVKRVDILITWQAYGGTGGTVRTSTLVADYS
ncbi:MAG: prepilin-type N-terminal cleavage/methylation domain-containing protein [Armatimonadota bacterium]|nr:prepilin-type N-terminal cleavage/methylation domain-containing protein [Armatimonadota bacterium]